jgi:hypothetical protein
MNGMERRTRQLIIAGLTLIIGAAIGRASAADESGQRERTFARAIDMLEHAKTPDDYHRAAAEFESMLSGGYRNGGVFYDIGNAYMGAQDYGKAIGAYRKAKYFLPRDPFLDVNLREALRLAPGHLAEAPPPWWTHVLFWTSWLSYPEKMNAALAAWAVGAGLAAIALLARFRRGYWLSAAAICAAVALSLDAGLSYSDVFNSRHAVVVEESIARKGNSPEYAPAFDKPLKDGAEFTIVDRRGEWVLGHFEGVGDGWVKQNAIVE